MRPFFSEMFWGSSLKRKPQKLLFWAMSGMSAKDVKAATRGPVIGGVCYILFAFVPMLVQFEPALSHRNH